MNVFGLLMRRQLLFLSLLLICTKMSSQVQVKIGYNMGFISSDVYDQMVQEFNLSNFEQIDIPLAELKFMHGIELGARYQLNGNAIEFSWNNLKEDGAAVGETASGGLFEEEFFYSMNQFALAFENFFGPVSIGTGIGYNKISFRERIAGSEHKRNLISDSQWTAKISIAYNFISSRSVSFAIKPYVQVPLTKINLADMAEGMNIPPRPNTSEGFLHWGLSFVFYNGNHN